MSTAYHLEVIDVLGCTYSSNLSCIVYVNYLDVNELLNTENLVNIYPNPTNGTIFLQDEEQSTKSIQIFDANGRFVAEILPSNFPYDMSHFAKSTYFLQIETEQGIEKRTVVLE